MNMKLKSILGLFSYIIMVGVNALAIVLPINQKTTVELSNKYDNLFVPAGFTFSIWSIIYILILIFVIQLIVSAFNNRKDIPFGLPNLFFITCACNALWIVAWHYERTFLSVCIMLVLLITLCIIYLGIRSMPNKSKAIPYTLQLPFSIYLAWISVATIANISAYLTKLHWQGWGLSPVIWTIIMITIALILCLKIIHQYRDIGFTLTICWALWGIYANLKYKNVEDPFFMYIPLTGIAILILFSLYKYFYKTAN